MEVVVKDLASRRNPEGVTFHGVKAWNGKLMQKCSLARFYFFFSFCFFFFFSAVSYSVVAVKDSRTELPCDLTPPEQDDSVYLVLWFKEGSDIPIYT
jgi:hypothetical protein